MSTAYKIYELISEEELKNLGLRLFHGGRVDIEYHELTSKEVNAIRSVISMVEKYLSRIAPELAEDWRKHESIFIKFGGVAKALFDGKPIQVPSTPGTIGVAPLFPEAIKYTATPSSSEPAYTSYKNNSWEIDLVAGTPAYILGDGTNYYRACPTNGRRCLIVIMQDGLIEISTTPRIYQMKIWTDVESKYGAFPVHPLIEVPLEKGLHLYQYNTLGVIPIYHDTPGWMWKVLPHYSGTSKLVLLGLVFYEHEFYADTKWI